ncbi:DNA-directed RNA polymerase subunit beta [Corchorus olitorius]|uniref:DNA-directed RNA polymerase subunit beta n=1 Tax=Corchorus olitorius TaxID=93759 RepID=A0A1R3KT37_9ROSI|nr:DNA-directed RNA polymerase subunit beta [Corchorus olitorius]
MAANGSIFYPSRMKFKVILCKTPPQRDRRRLEIPTRVSEKFFPGLVLLRTVLVDRREDLMLFSLRDNDILEVKCFFWCCMESDDFGQRETHGHEIPGSIFGEEENQDDRGDNAAESNNPNEVDAVEQNNDVEMNDNSNLIHCDQGVHVAAAQFRSENKHFIWVLPMSVVARPFLMV